MAQIEIHANPAIQALIARHQVQTGLKSRSAAVIDLLLKGAVSAGIDTTGCELPEHGGKRPGAGVRRPPTGNT